VSVGTDHDTGAFAVASGNEGRAVYPRAKALLITADGRGSNGSRLRLWKLKTGGRNEPLDFPLSLPVRHQQVEQGAAPPAGGEPLRDYETTRESDLALEDR